MTIRNLDTLLKVRSVAIIGASERAGSVGHVVLENIRQAGFAVAIYPVNVKYQEVSGFAVLPPSRRLADRAGPRGDHDTPGNGVRSD